MSTDKILEMHELALENESKNDNFAALFYYKSTILLIDGLNDGAALISLRNSCLLKVNTLIDITPSNIYKFGFNHNVGNSTQSTIFDSFPPPSNIPQMPKEPVAKFYWITRNLVNVLNNGGYLTFTLYVPHSIFNISNVYLENLDFKANVLDSLSNCLTSKNSLPIVSFLDDFETLMEPFIKDLKKKPKLGNSGLLNKLSKGVKSLVTRNDTSLNEYMDSLIRFLKAVLFLESVYEKEIYDVRERIRGIVVILKEHVVGFILRDIGVLYERFLKKGRTALVLE